METVLVAKVTLDRASAICWPAIASRRTRATLPALPTAAVTPCVGAMRPVETTSAATYGAGGTNRSAVLVAVPPGVVTDSRPDAPAVGTVIARLLALAAVTGTTVTLSLARSFAGVGSKL